MSLNKNLISYVYQLIFQFCIPHILDLMICSCQNICFGCTFKAELGLHLKIGRSSKQPNKRTFGIWNSCADCPSVVSLYLSLSMIKVHCPAVCLSVCLCICLCPLSRCTVRPALEARRWGRATGWRPRLPWGRSSRRWAVGCPYNQHITVWDFYQ